MKYKKYFLFIFTTVLIINCNNERNEKIIGLNETNNKYAIRDISFEGFDYADIQKIIIENIENGNKTILYSDSSFKEDNPKKNYFTMKRYKFYKDSIYRIVLKNKSYIFKINSLKLHQMNTMFEKQKGYILFDYYLNDSLIRNNLINIRFNK